MAEKESKAGLWAAIAAVITAGGAVLVALISRSGDSGKPAITTGTGGSGSVSTPNPPPDSLSPYTVAVLQDVTQAPIAGATCQLLLDDGVGFDVQTSSAGTYTFNLKASELVGQLNVYKDGYRGVAGLSVNLNSGVRHDTVNLPLASAAAPPAPTASTISNPSKQPGKRSLSILAGQTRWIYAAPLKITRPGIVVNPRERMR